MSPLLIKEIRLLLPAYVMALLLAIVPIWLLPETHGLFPSQTAIIFSFCLGIVVLALSCFGREFALRTFPLQLVQPLERSRIWWTKIKVLAIAMTTVMAAWLVSATCFGFAVVRSFRGIEVAQHILLTGATATVLIFSGALWSTLLLRQIIAAFWFTILIPGAIALGMNSNEKIAVFLWPVLALYSIGGFLWAWRQFLHAQETGWTGGVINIAGWRSTTAIPRASMRSHRPIAALFWKELQLHQVGLVGMAGLFALHLVVVLIRTAGHHFSDTWRVALQVFGGIWLIVPLLAGSTSVAEERKLDTHQAQLTLPISSRIQFGIKFLFALILGGILSPILLFTAEGIGIAIGAGSDLTKMDPASVAMITLTFFGLSLASFYASTVSRHVVQSLAVAVGTVAAVPLFIAFASRPIVHFGPNISGENFFVQNEIWLWRGNLIHYIAWPTLVLTFVWLASRNFRSTSFLRRNVLAFTGALLFIVGSTSAIYNRAWELITPLEPAHGPARLMGPNPTKLDSYGGNGLAAVLPDGRLWVDRVTRDPGTLFLAFGQTDQGYRRSSTVGARLGSKWLSLSGNYIFPGTNWVDAVANFSETIAIRSDGTLWVSEKPRQTWDPDRGQPPPIEQPAPLVQFGTETNWQNAVRYLWDNTVLLLKTDGTLWRWSWLPKYGKQREWPGYRHFEPHLLKAELKWAKIVPGENRAYGWQEDGRAWTIHPTERAYGSDKFEPTANQVELEPGVVMERMPGLDNIICKRVVSYFRGEVALREDGTLWAWRYQYHAKTRESVPTKPMQIGRSRDWVALAGLGGLAAVKADGSLWRLNVYGIYAELPESQERLGRHNDWLAVGSLEGSIVSLAADGSLWYWWDQNRDFYNPNSSQPLLAASRKPSKIENILGK
jgi:hypothetical protein